MSARSNDYELWGGIPPSPFEFKCFSVLYDDDELGGAGLGIFLTLRRSAYICTLQLGRLDFFEYYHGKGKGSYIILVLYSLSERFTRVLPM